MLPGERPAIAIIGGSPLANYGTLNFWCCSSHFPISNIPHKKSRIGANKSFSIFQLQSLKFRVQFWCQFAIIFLFSIEFAGLSDPLEIQGGTPHSIFRSDAQRSVKQKERKKQELERQVFHIFKFTKVVFTFSQKFSIVLGTHTLIELLLFSFLTATLIFSSI